MCERTRACSEAQLEGWGACASGKLGILARACHATITRILVAVVKSLAAWLRAWLPGGQLQQNVAKARCDTR